MFAFKGKPLIALATILAIGCGETIAPTTMDGAVTDARTVDAANDVDAQVSRVPYLTEIPTLADYQRIEGPGEELKYSLQVDGREPVLPHACVFPDTLRFPYHLSFLREHFENLRDLDLPTYARYVLEQNSRRIWGGHLKHFANLVHPISGERDLYGFIVYQGDGPNEDLQLEQVVEVFRRIASCAPFLANRLVFLPDNKQRQNTQNMQVQLRANQVAVLFPEQLASGNYEVYVPGESYGYLHIQTIANQEATYGPRDVVALEAAPSEISLVSGLITRYPQSVHSHVNLRLREKNIPSAMQQDFRSDPRFAQLENRLVHMRADANSLLLEEASLEDAERFWNATRPTVVLPPANLLEISLRSLSDLQHASRDAYGAKAANLGELQRALPEANRPTGFAIPFSAYRDFVTQNNLQTRIDALLENDAVRTSAAVRASELEALRNAFKRGVVSNAWLEDLRARIVLAFGEDGLSQYMRFRSSSNVEDLVELSGAGLYDSASGCMADDLDGDELGPSRCLTPAFAEYMRNEKSRLEVELAAYPDRLWISDLIAELEEDLREEKPVAKALTKVWRSLWNLRAFEEREYYGIDQRQIYMGAAVHPRFVMEAAEAVAVTNLPSSLPLYRVIVQHSDVGVVRPSDPSAVAELFTFQRDTGSSSAINFQTLARSNRVPEGQHVLSEGERQELAALLFAVQDHFRANVYLRDALRLDLEIEWLEVQGSANRRAVIKQARPYLSEE